MGYFSLALIGPKAQITLYKEGKEELMPYEMYTTRVASLGYCPPSSELICDLEISFLHDLPSCDISITTIFAAATHNKIVNVIKSLRKNCGKDFETALTEKDITELSKAVFTHDTPFHPALASL